MKDDLVFAVAIIDYGCKAALKSALMASNRRTDKMNVVASIAPEASEDVPAPKTVKLQIEVLYTLAAGKTILDVLASAKTLFETAANDGSATGLVVFGRQKFPL